MDRQAQRLSGALGGHRSWANTTDRAARMQAAQSRSPTGWNWHAQKRFGRNYDELPPNQQQQVKSDRLAYFAEMRRRSAATRRANRSERLRRKAAKIQAEADALDNAEAGGP
jgi:hypothetical protein